MNAALAQEEITLQLNSYSQVELMAEVLICRRLSGWQILMTRSEVLGK